MSPEFRDDPLALARLVEGNWERLPPQRWRLDWSAPLGSLNKRSVRKAGSGILYTRVPHQVQAQLELAAKHPEKWALITPDAANIPRSTEFGVLRVPDLGAARDKMAMASRQHYPGKVVAVTGSVGKTTVRRMLDTTLRAHHSVHTSRRIDNGFRALRDQLLSLSDRDFATLEIARIALPGGEDLARPDVAVIGALAEAHMEDLGSVKDIARIKAQLLKGVPKAGTGVINIDSPHVAEVLQIAEQQGISTITYGQHAEADIQLVNYDPKSAACQVQAFDREIRYQISAPGRHNAVNSLAVLGVLIALKLPVATYLEALSSFTPVRGRGMTHQVSVDDKSVTVVDESYNANPTSMRAALQGFGDNYPDLRKLLVLGDMLELGPASPEFHAGLAPDVLSLSPAFVVLVGPQMRELYEALPDTQPALHIDDASQLGTSLMDQLQDEDAVFVKASLGTKLRGVVEGLVNHSK